MILVWTKIAVTSIKLLETSIKLFRDFDQSQFLKEIISSFIQFVLAYNKIKFQLINFGLQHTIGGIIVGVKTSNLNSINKNNFLNV